MANEPNDKITWHVNMCELLMLLEYNLWDCHEVPLKMFMGGLKTITIDETTRDMVFTASDGDTYVLAWPTNAILSVPVTRIAEDVYEITWNDDFFVSRMTFIKKHVPTLCQLYNNSVFENERVWKWAVIYLMLNPGEFIYDFKEMATHGFTYSKELRPQVVDEVTYKNNRLFTLGNQVPKDDLRLQYLRTQLPNDVLSFKIGKSRHLDINVSDSCWDLWFDKGDVKITEPLNLLTQVVSWEAYQESNGQ